MRHLGRAARAVRCAQTARARVHSTRGAPVSRSAAPTRTCIPTTARLRLSNSVLTPPNGENYLLQVGVSLAPMDRALERFLFLLVTGVPAGLIATFVIGRWMARFALTPLTRLAEVDTDHQHRGPRPPRARPRRTRRTGRRGHRVQRHARTARARHRRDASVQHGPCARASDAAGGAPGRHRNGACCSEAAPICSSALPANWRRSTDSSG